MDDNGSILLVLAAAAVLLFVVRPAALFGPPAIVPPPPPFRPDGVSPGSTFWGDTTKLSTAGCKVAAGVAQVPAISSLCQFTPWNLGVKYGPTVVKNVEAANLKIMGAGVTAAKIGIAGPVQAIKATGGVLASGVKGAASAVGSGVHAVLGWL
jgi:hypothetical protein